MGGMGLGGVGVHHGHGISSNHHYYNQPPPHQPPHEGVAYEKHPSSSSLLLPLPTSSSTKSTSSTSMHMNLQHLSLSLSDKEIGLSHLPTQSLSLVVDGLPSTQSDAETSPRLPSGSRSPSMASDVSGGGSQLSSYQLHALRLQEQHEERRKTQQQQTGSSNVQVHMHTCTYHLVTSHPRNPPTSPPYLNTKLFLSFFLSYFLCPPPLFRPCCYHEVPILTSSLPCLPVSLWPPPCVSETLSMPFTLPPLPVRHRATPPQTVDQTMVQTSIQNDIIAPPLAPARDLALVL